MSSKKTPVTLRAVGQRSLPSLFSSCSKKPAQVVGQDPDKGSHVSLSDPLEGKLQRTSEKPTTVKERVRPFSSVFGASRDLSESTDEQIVAKKGGKSEKNPIAEFLAFEQLKHNDFGKGHSIGPSTASGVESSDEDVIQESSTRRNPFEGRVDKPIARKHFTELGGDPKPNQTRRDESFISTEKPGPVYNHCGGVKRFTRKHFTVLGGDPKPKPNRKRRRDESFVNKDKPGPAYNYYANGSGWWDCDREGIDNEEVGVNEVWEGVGSTTLGGIEWH